MIRRPPTSPLLPTTTLFRSRCRSRRQHLRSPATRFPRFRPRSEEHTSELQSRLHVVCRLLLEKKITHRDSQVHSPIQITHATDVTQTSTQYTGSDPTIPQQH